MMVNRALLRDYNLKDSLMLVGKYNIFRDYTVTTAELVPFSKRAFNGETFFIPNIKVPLVDISSYFGIEDFDIEAMFIDITIFPIYDKNGNIPYAAAMLAKKQAAKSLNGKYLQKPAWFIA